MSFKKDSLVFKIVFYNNLAIIISSVVIAFFLIFIDFNEREKNIKNMTKEKMELLNKAIDEYILKLREETYISASESTFSTDENNVEKKIRYFEISEKIRKNLLNRNVEAYDKTLISIVDKNGFIVAESGLAQEKKMSTLKKSEAFKDLFLSGKLDSENYSVEAIQGRNYIRAFFPHYLETGKFYIVVSIPFDYQFIQKMKKFISFYNRDKIFIISGENYYAGDFYYNANIEMKHSDFLKFFKRIPEVYRYGDKEIEGIRYHVGVSSIVDHNGKYQGLLGIAISREELINSKVKAIMGTLLLLLIFIILVTNIFSRFFKRLLKPLIKVTEAATEIGNGNYSYNLDIYTNELGEVHKLVSSFKKMMKEIKYTHNRMTKQNLELRENIVRIEAIERLLMGLHIESDMSQAIKTLLSALTSDMGLGYSRAMYFRYSRERDCFLGDLTSVNRNLDLEENVINKGFKFQVTELDRLIKTIKIPYQNDNLIGKSLKESKVMFFNHKGYKYDLGNDLFKSLGIHNFMIIPIYSKTRNYGCILVDYFGKNKMITHEEYELTTLLAMNISIRIRNKLIEEEKIDKERELTITKLTERFLGSRNETLSVYMDIINKYKSGVRDLKEEFTNLEPMINKIEKENHTLKEYSEIMKDNFELIDIETIFSEIIEEQKENYDDNKITLSLFINYTGKVYGNRQSLKKAFYELIKNSYLALLKSENKEKKINIIVSKDKHIDKVKITIIDNGIGMKENLLSKIYQPFLSVDGEVPGLGLSLVYRIVKEHFGVIKFFSKYLEGTEVRITLNAYEEETK